MSETYTVERYDTEAAWFEARRTGIGASDAAVVLGVSPWKSRFALWGEKAKGIVADVTEVERMTWGRLLEPVIADRYASVTGRQLVDPGRYTIHRSIEYPFLCATLDREIHGDERGVGVLEIKAVSAYASDEWDGDEPPLMYQVQVQHAMQVRDAQWGVLAALIGGQRLVHFELVRNDAFCAALVEQCAAFWQLVQKGEPPEVDASEATAALLARLYPEDTGEIVDLPADAVTWDEQRRQAMDEIKKWETVKAGCDANLKAAIGDATIGVLPNGAGRYAWKVTQRKEYVVKASAFRQLRRLNGA